MRYVRHGAGSNARPVAITSSSSRILELPVKYSTGTEPRMQVPCYYFRAPAAAIKVMETGDGVRPSGLGAMIRNTLRWLGEP